jgi:hypothetical protein
MRAMLGADGVSRHSLEGSGERDGDFLWLPFVRVGIDHPVSLVPRSEASETVRRRPPGGSMWETLVSPPWSEMPR